ncbi:uncharacterized protein PG998_005299 [Apiospora kogelbergensis]|uniref:Uncharacterized protein n=1 Tax=Apiospora kogelbergensis TaxID=1337665 RepID=A0AAW0Q8P1_9PEZI
MKDEEEEEQERANIGEGAGSSTLPSPGHGSPRSDFRHLKPCERTGGRDGATPRTAAVVAGGAQQDRRSVQADMDIRNKKLVTGLPS